MTAIVLPMTFPCAYDQVCITPAFVDTFLQNPSAWMRSPELDSIQSEFAWLDQHAPGWSIKVVCDGPREGPDTRPNSHITVISYQTQILFRQRPHRDAWRAFVSALPPVTLPAHMTVIQHCPHCATQMTSYRDVEMRRMAQVALSYGIEGMRCEACAHEELSISNPATFNQTYDHVMRRLGLRMPQDAGWSQELEDAWRYRADSPPELELFVDDDTPPGVLVQDIDTFMRASSRWQPRVISGRRA